MLRQSWWNSRTFLAPDGDGAAGGTGAGTSSDSTATSAAATTDTSAASTAATADSDAALGDAGKAALQRERDAREAADKEVKRLQKIVDDAAAATRKREADEAKAKGDFESLAKTAQEERDALKAELAKRDRDDLKRTVAAKHKLSPELAARLVGETEAELEADAKTLAKLTGAREAPDTEAGAGARGAAGTSDRPVVKKSAAGEKTPAFAFDGRQKVAWPNRG